MAPHDKRETRTGYGPLAGVVPWPLAPLPLRLLALPLLLLLLLLLLLPVATADCECGYAARTAGAAGAGSGGGRQVFTELLEADFARVADVGRDTDWARQAWNMSSAQARGQFGEMFAAAGVATTTGKKGKGGRGDEAAAAAGGGDAGLLLTVAARTVDGLVPGAEIASSRTDLLWGTYRASMKLTGVPGTCGAFFWYFNDTEEIDMEFLSREFDAGNGSYPVNLVLQSRAALEAGYNAQGTGNFLTAQLPFDPRGGFHEYRIDFLPGQVAFYAEGRLLGNMSGAAVPTSPGHLMLQHWSNGNALWSGGPPAEDAVMTVRYVKAYFNSSEARRAADHAARCVDPAAPGAVCEVPEITAGDDSAAGWFFSQRQNMTNNQTVWRESGGSRGRPGGRAALAVLALAGGWTLALW